MNPIFAFNDNVVRVLGTADEPLFVAADICRALQIVNTSQAIAGVPEDEKGITQAYTLGGEQSLLVLKEPGLYRLIFRSDKAEARKFQDWVFKEVLPQIRKTGQYSAPWLREAFTSARSGKVQLALLAALGIVSPQEAAQLRQERALGTAIDVERFWMEVSAAVEQGRLAAAAFRLKGATQLFVHPPSVLKALASSGPCNRADLRATLSLQREWIAGEHTMRLADFKTTEKMWGFDVNADAPEGLRKLLARLSQK